MPQYVPVTSTFRIAQVGAVYNIGIGDGTNTYGYLFQPDPKGGMIERSNVADKQALIQYSSSNLIDRDLVYYPRVTQGDFSGGALQTVLLDETKYFDSDLEIRTPGLLVLRPGWTRTTMATGVPAVQYQCVSYRGNVYSAWFGGGNTHYYDAFGTQYTPGINPQFLDSDGNVLFIADGASTLMEWNVNTPGTFVTLSNTIGPIKQMWYINLGTNGRFIYYTNDGTSLFRWDLNAGTSSAVPIGNQFWSLVDICVFSTGIAIATRGSQRNAANAIITGGYSDIWFHDGANLTRMVTLDELEVVGLCNCLGNLYCTANSTGSYEAPVLLQVSSSSITVAVRPGSPLVSQTSAAMGPPTASGQYVYFAILAPQISNVTPVNYIGVYDTISESYSHLPNLSPDDAPSGTRPRQLACSGRAVAFPMTDQSGNAVLQNQTNSSLLPFSAAYMFSGTMVSSKIDFATPAIPKRFRRIEVQHAPLTASESIQIKAFVDQDPLSYAAGNTPTATVTNSTMGSTTTGLMFGSDIVGKTMYYALILNGPNNATPQVEYVAVEVGGTWTWEFVLDCSSKRRLLNGDFEDQQGVTGKDLYYLLRNAYENGSPLTLYLAEGASYTVQIEEVDVVSPAYTDHSEYPVRADQEWTVHVVFNQVATALS